MPGIPPCTPGASLFWGWRWGPAAPASRSPSLIANPPVLCWEGSAALPIALFHSFLLPGSEPGQLISCRPGANCLIGKVNHCPSSARWGASAGQNPALRWPRASKIPAIPQKDRCLRVLRVQARSQAGCRQLGSEIFPSCGLQIARDATAAKPLLISSNEEGRNAGRKYRRCRINLDLALKLKSLGGSQDK